MGVGDPLDEVEFVSRSRHRVHVLETLASSPHTRSDLHETIDIPQPTLSRVIRDFENRKWVRREGQEYYLTPLGQLLAEEFASLLKTVETIGELRTVIDWLPCEKFDFGLEHFADAEITLVERDDVIAPVRRAIEAFEAADRLRILAPGFVPEIIEARWKATVHGTQTSEAVLPADVIDSIMANPETARWYEDVVRSDRATVYRYDGSVSYAIASIDDIAVFMRFSTPGTPQAMIETADEAVRSWVDETIDAYQDDAEPVDPDTLTS